MKVNSWYFIWKCIEFVCSCSHIFLFLLLQVTSVYTCKRMTARWPVIVFYNILDVSAYNSFVLWSEINAAWNKGKYNRRRLFMEELGRQLVIPHIKQRMVSKLHFLL